MVAASMIRRHRTTHGKATPVMLGALDPAYRTGRSIFPSRVFDPDEVGRVLKDGHQSRKIGKVVTKGPRKGWPIFTLTLEERATCPRNCKAWAFCMGNNMHAAERITAGEALEEALWNELLQLQFDHPRGFLVRLHVLGDFYSLDYVRLWERALQAFPALHVFGFTAHDPASEIGSALWDITNLLYERFALRFSGFAERDLGSVLEGNDGFDQAIQCPAQTEATDCCATCGLCWQTRRTIGFLRH